MHFLINPMEQIRKADLESYLDSLYPNKGDQIANRRYWQHLKYMKAFFSWVVREYQCEVNPCALIGNGKGGRKDRPVKGTELKVAQYEAVVKMIETSSGQDRNLLATLWWTGGRRTQTLELKWADVDFKRNVIHFRTQKTATGGEVTKEVPLLSFVVPYLKDQEKQYRELSKDGSVFLNLNASARNGKGYCCGMKYNSGFVTRMAAKAGVAPFSYHAMRRGVATFLYDNDVPFEDIQAVLAHDDLETTKKYIHKLRPARKARESIEARLKGKI
jgi:integrase